MKKHPKEDSKIAIRRKRMEHFILKNKSTKTQWSLLVVGKYLCCCTMASVGTLTFE